MIKANIITAFGFNRSSTTSNPVNNCTICVYEFLWKPTYFMNSGFLHLNKKIKRKRYKYRCTKNVIIGYCNDTWWIVTLGVKHVLTAYQYVSMNHIGAYTLTHSSRRKCPHNNYEYLIDWFDMFTFGAYVIMSKQ